MFIIVWMIEALMTVLVDEHRQQLFQHSCSENWNFLMLMNETTRALWLVAYTYHSTVDRLFGTLQCLIMVVEEVVAEQMLLQARVVVVVVLKCFVMDDDCYSFLYFHSNDSMDDFHRTAVVVEKNYSDMMNDCYMMIGHNAMALNHIDEVHVMNYHDHGLDHDGNYYDNLMMNHRLHHDTTVDYCSYDVDYDHGRMLYLYLLSQ